MKTDLESAAGASRVNILCVDDRPETLLALQAILDATNYNLVLAESGAAALNAVLTHDFAVILMDVAMPDLSGIEATRRLVADEIATRILVHSADTSPDLVAAARAAGAAGYLLKRGRSAPLLDAIRVVHAGGAIWPDGDQAAGTTPAP